VKSVSEHPPFPAVRRDGKCRVCRGTRVIPSTRQKGVPREVYETDPFCSTVCAKAYFEELAEKEVA
jgi:hypothetical protein